jgi:adenine phosphoribosyltransferase
VEVLDQQEKDYLLSTIRDIKDFPKPGIVFKDITVLLKNAEAFNICIDLLTEPFKNDNITAVAGMESRGFIFGVPSAMRLGVGFVPIRKPGKLPGETVSQSYQLEYGTDILEMHTDAVTSNDKVLIIDDLLATGGTAAAALNLVKKAGATVAGAAFVLELDFLKGKDKLKDCRINSIVHVN